MNLDRVTSGRSLPDDFNVIIEIPMNADPIKYEVDKDTGALFVDRFMMTAMHYPCNYGYIPHTLSDDRDPVDVLVITPVPVTVGAVIRCRPVGNLKMDDEAGGDAKLLAVPVHEVLADLQALEQARGPATRTLAADPALLPALQGSRTWPMGEGRRVGRAGRGTRRDLGGGGALRARPAAAKVLGKL